MKPKLYFFPLLLLMAAFLLDKQLYIGGFEDTFLRTATFLNYEHKIDMLDELSTYLQTPRRRKVLVLFGNSRTMSFENSYLEAKYKDWIWFNFSVPGGTSDYFYFLLGEMKKRGIRPDVAILTITPQGFNAAPSAPIDEVLISGVSFPFILHNMSHYTVDDLMNYSAKKLFWNYRYRPKAEVIISRLENNAQGLRIFHQWEYQTAVQLRENRGSVPFQFHGIPAHDEEFLTAHAKSTWQDFFTPYRLSRGQVYFTERSIQTLKEENVPMILLWAKVQQHLRDMKDTIIVTRPGEKPQTVRGIWTPIMQEMSSRYKVPFVDMNYGSTIQCDHFYDSSHLASVCFPEFADFIMREVKNLQ